jgi:hypothetical protein
VRGQGRGPGLVAGVGCWGPTSGAVVVAVGWLGGAGRLGSNSQRQWRLSSAVWTPVHRGGSGRWSRIRAKAAPSRGRTVARRRMTGDMQRWCIGRSQHQCQLFSKLEPKFLLYAHGEGNK